MSSCGIENKSPKNITGLAEDLRTKYEINLYNQFVSDLHILDSTILVQNLSLDTLRLTDLLKEPTVIFRISELHCNICVDQEIAKLNEYFSQIKQQAIILTSYSNARNYIIFKRINQLEAPIYRMLENISLPVEQALTPYLCNISISAGKTKKCHIRN